MKFIETPIFTADVQKLLTDDEYRELQLVLLLRPEAGSVIPGSSGLRKLRWKQAGQGKRGGLRVIYYNRRQEALYLLVIYRKAEQEDLTHRQLCRLRRIVQENLE